MARQETVPADAPDPPGGRGGRACRRGRGIRERRAIWQRSPAERRAGSRPQRGRGLRRQGRRRARRSPRRPPATSRRCCPPIRRNRCRSLAFNAPDGKPMTLADRAGKTRACSTSGRPGARPAAPRCRRSTRCSKQRRRRFRGGGDQCRHRRRREAEEIPGRDRRQDAGLLPRRLDGCSTCSRKRRWRSACR